jgi:hypothetical protein
VQISSVLDSYHEFFLLGDLGERSISLRCLPNAGPRPSRHTPYTPTTSRVLCLCPPHSHRSHDFGLYCICFLRCSSFVFSYFYGLFLSSLSVKCSAVFSICPTSQQFPRSPKHYHICLPLHIRYSLIEYIQAQLATVRLLPR